MTSIAQNRRFRLLMERAPTMLFGKVEQNEPRSVADRDKMPRSNEVKYMN
jgi:hypothetical protein